MPPGEIGMIFPPSCCASQEVGLLLLILLIVVGSGLCVRMISVCQLLGLEDTLPSFVFLGAVAILTHILIQACACRTLIIVLIVATVGSAFLSIAEQIRFVQSLIDEEVDPPRGAEPPEVP